MYVTTDNCVLRYKRTDFLFLNVSTAPSRLPYFWVSSITLRHNKFARTPRDQLPTDRKGLYLIIHKNLKRQIATAQRDSNPQSQQASGRRFTPQTLQPPRSALWYTGKCKGKSVAASNLLDFALWKLTRILQLGRLQWKYDGTRWRTGGEVKGKPTNGVCS